jgi:hypothetical protein
MRRRGFLGLLLLTLLVLALARTLVDAVAFVVTLPGRRSPNPRGA